MFEKLFVESFFITSLFVNAVLFFPQIIQLYRCKDSESVSFITFAGFEIINIFTMWHGYLHHDLLLGNGTLLSVVTNGIVVLQILYYKKRSLLKEAVGALD